MKTTRLMVFALTALITVLLAGTAQAQKGAFVSFKGIEISTGHEEGEQLVCPIAPAQPNERADVPQLVGRVVLPVPPAVSPVDELPPVPLECAEHQIGG